MALRIEHVSKSFGSLQALIDVDLEFPHGQLICLLGPSGCGKTTLLRCIAGLETPTGGRIRLDGEDLTGTPAHKRNFGMVFQSLALFPHLSVGDNIVYGLRIRGVDQAACRQRAAELLELVRLPGVADRPVAQLSGGQRQRVAIARALALNPKLFLLDEPLSALDAKLREAMQVELRLLQRRLGISTIVVTHDQREAMTMADIVVVMDHGRVQQVASPLDTYRSPSNAFVADFIGISNLVPGTLSGADTVLVDGRPIRVARLPERLADGARVILLVRPEEVHVRSAQVDGENHLSGEVSFVRDLGASVEITVRCGEQQLLAVTTPRERPRIEIGDPVAVELPAAACVVLPS
jgi:putative spermidine/putrescine transport system ATP-binding protein